MCFSAEASFGAAVVISTVGVVAYKKAEKSPYRLLAIIPLFFGIQQFSEGIVWLAATTGQFSGFLTLSTYAFIFFAWIIWPIYIPAVLWRLETQALRKKILFSFMLIGFLIGLVLAYILISQGVVAEIKDCSIGYNYGFTYAYGWVLSIFYLATTVGSNLVSSTGKMWILGVINLLTYFISSVYYNEHIISVWCFFAAISSVVIWLIIHQLKKNPAGKRD